MAFDLTSGASGVSHSCTLDAMTAISSPRTNETMFLYVDEPAAQVWHLLDPSTLTTTRSQIHGASRGRHNSIF